MVDEYLLGVSNRPQASKEVRGLHVHVTVDREELLSSQSCVQLADGGFPTSAEETDNMG